MKPVDVAAGSMPSKTLVLQDMQMQWSTCSACRMFRLQQMRYADVQVEVPVVD